MIDPKNGNPKISSQGYPFGKYANSDLFMSKDGIIDHPTLQFATPKPIFDNFTEQQKDATNILKSFCNKRPTCYFWHNGTPDDGCQFNGLHIHLIVQNPYPIYMQHTYKVMKKVLLKYGIQVKCQKVKYLEALMNHLQKEPRILLGYNNLGLAARLKKTRGDNPFYAGLDITDFDEDEEVQQKNRDDGGAFMTGILKYKKERTIPSMSQVINQLSQADNMDRADSGVESIKLGDGSQKPLAMTKQAHNVDRLKELMRKYNKYTDEELMRAVVTSRDTTDLMTMRILSTMSYYKTTLSQAVTEIRLENEVMGVTYIDKFIRECPSPTDTLNVEQTAELHKQWCRDQGIQIGDYMMKQYCVLAKVFPKLKCMMLQGQSNAGKTYWTLPSMPFPDTVGQTVQSQDFAFQKCLNKDLIQIPEMTLSKNEQVEEIKKIFEGIPTTINVKNKEPRVLDRTPVILTCNQVPWRFFSEEQDAFQNRMFAFQNLYASPLLEGKKGANPKYFRRVFEYIHTEIAQLPEFLCLPDDKDMWTMYVDLVEAHIEGLILQKEINMQHLLESEDVQYKYLMREEYLDEHPDHNVLMKRADVRLECEESCLLKEVYSWIFALFTPSTDDYAFQWIQGKIEMVSQFAGGIYDGEQDLDYQDYMNFRSGYTHLKRMLLRLKTWPTDIDNVSTLEDIMKCSLKKTIEYLAKYLGAFLNEHKDKCRALRESWEACEMDLPTKEEFAQGLKRVREDLVTILDEPDGKRIKTCFKKLQAVIPGVTLNCTSSEKAVVINCGPPSLDVDLKESGTNEPSDPWREVRPYHKEHQDETSMDTQPPSPKVPIDHPKLPVDDIDASLKESLMSFEDMYNIMAADAEITSKEGDENEPIIVD